MGGRVVAIAFLGVGALIAGCTTLAGIDKEYVREDAIEPDSFGGFAGTSSAGGEGGFGGLGGAGSVSGEGGAGGTDGASGSDGAGGTDGASGTDGVGSTGGSVPDAAGGTGGTHSGGASGMGGGSPCEAGKKRCGDACVKTDDPNFGCSIDGCTPCPDPVPNSMLFCGERTCAAACKVGFIPREGQCVDAGTVDGGAGAAGNGGVGGNGGTAGRGGTSGRGGSGGFGGRQCVESECPRCQFLAQPCCTFFRTCGCSHVELFYCI